VGFGDSDTAVSCSFPPAISADDYLQVRLAADSGPFGTRDYAIALEAAPLDASRTPRGAPAVRVRLTHHERTTVA
jgi:hypothetical protein